MPRARSLKRDCLSLNRRGGQWGKQARCSDVLRTAGCGHGARHPWPPQNCFLKKTKRERNNGALGSLMRGAHFCHGYRASRLRSESISITALRNLPRVIFCSHPHAARARLHAEHCYGSGLRPPGAARAPSFRGCRARDALIVFSDAACDSPCDGG